MKDEIIDVESACARFGALRCEGGRWLEIETSHGVWKPMYETQDGSEASAYVLSGYRFEPHVLRRARAH